MFTGKFSNDAHPNTLDLSAGGMYTNIMIDPLKINYLSTNRRNFVKEGVTSNDSNVLEFNTTNSDSYISMEAYRGLIANSILIPNTLGSNELIELNLSKFFSILSSYDATISALNRRIDELTATVTANSNSISGIIGTNTGTPPLTLNEVATNIGSLSTKVTNAEQTIGSLSTNIGSLSTKVTNAEQSIETLTTNLTAAGAAIHDVKQQANALQSASTDQFRQIRQAMDETRSNINTLTTSVNSFSSSISTIQADLTATKTKLSDAKTEIGNNQVAITSIRNSIDDIRTNLNSTIREYNTLYSQVQSISTNVDGLSTRVRTLESNSSNISTIQNNINLLRQVCSSLKSQYIIKSWVPSVQTDNNGFLRLNMSQFPSDMQSKSNDYIVNVEPYDVRAANYETIIPQWTDWNGDQGINVRLTWHNNGSVGAGKSVKIFYWATNPAAALPLPS